MKKLISLILALIILAVPAGTAFAAVTEQSVNAAGQESGYVADCPYIYVHGFMGSTIYVDPDDPDSEAAWPPSSDRIKSAVGKILPSMLKVMITRNWERFADEVIPAVNEMFDPIYLNDSGEVPNKSGVRFSYPAKESITASSQLDYVYDWRVDPIESARGLNDFINYVLEASGCEQVVLSCHSYGGVVTTAYAKMFGTEKVRSWVFNSTAVYGETYNGELMTGKMTFEAEALTEYLKSAFDYNDNEDFFLGLFGFLYKTGITSLVCRNVNYMIKHITMDKLATGILPLFGRWLSVWSMIPDDTIDEAYDYVFNTVYKDDGVDRSKLREKIDSFNTDIRPYKAETIERINETSNYYVIARYGYCSLFMTPSWRNAADCTIDVKYASQGATDAQYGETLSADYISGRDAKYISPDKTIDASTCTYPEQTWFIRHYTHGSNCEALSEMIQSLLYYDGQATTETFSQYPRFLYFDEDTQQIIPDTYTEPEPSFIDKLRNLFKAG